MSIFYGYWANSFVYLLILGEFIPVFMDIGQIHSCIYGYWANSFVYLWILGELIRIFMHFGRIYTALCTGGG